MRRKLQDIFENKSWADGNSPRSGPGSTLEYTRNIRAALPELFRKYDVRTFVDAPCGDWTWMQAVDLNGIDYLGFDISSSVVTENQRRFSAPGVKFEVADVTSDVLPKADLFMCRDCLFHLKFWLRWEFFRRFLESGSKYLLTTGHPVDFNRKQMQNGQFLRFNPTKPPFSFAEPLEYIDEATQVTEDGTIQLAGGPRYIGLWSREQVRDAVQLAEV